MALWKCSPFHILTAEPNVISFKVQTEQRQRFACCPVQLVWLQRFQSFINVILFYTRVNCEIVRNRNWSLSKLFQHCEVKTCLELFSIQWRLEFRPLLSECSRTFTFRICNVFQSYLADLFGCNKLLFQILIQLVLRFLIKRLSDQSFLGQLLRILLGITLMCLSDLLIHFRLSELWLIDLVMPVFPVADQVH